LTETIVASRIASKDADLERALAKPSASRESGGADGFAGSLPAMTLRGKSRAG
jgi:hypothetical protein